MNIYFDIETIPTQRPDIIKQVKSTVCAPGTYKKPESIEKWMNENLDSETDKKLRSTALNGTAGEIICISWAIDDAPPQVIGRTLEDDEKEMLINFSSSIRKSLEQPHTDALIKPVWIGHYITGFDLRFLWQRYVINGIIPQMKIPYNDKAFSDNIFDTCVEWAGYKSTGFSKLDDISRALGYEGKGDIDGSKVWDYIKAGKYDEVEKYCMQDVVDVRNLHKRMTFSHT